MEDEADSIMAESKVLSLYAFTRYKLQECAFHSVLRDLANFDGEENLTMR
jgi:hypothetical protein